MNKPNIPPIIKDKEINAIKPANLLAYSLVAFLTDAIIFKGNIIVLVINVSNAYNNIAPPNTNNTIETMADALILCNVDISDTKW